MWLSWRVPFFSFEKCTVRAGGGGGIQGSTVFTPGKKPERHRVGAGIIGLPYALHRAGFWFGLFLMLFVGWLIDFGVRNLVATGARHKKLDYELIVEHCFGSRGYYTVVVAMFFFAYGAMIG